MMAGATRPPDAVVGALLVRPGGVLLCHRSADRTWYPDVWDVPGGHVDGGETPAAALVRELREELGVVIAEPPGPALARVAGSDFELSIWVIRD
jgi:8-oxo-dGTP diphosphatase